MSKYAQNQKIRQLLALYYLSNLNANKLLEIIYHHQDPTHSQILIDPSNNSASNFYSCSDFKFFDAKDNCVVPNIIGKANWNLVDKELAWAENENCHILLYDDDHYPALLKQIHKPPPILYVRGDIAAFSQPTLAIIGSRNPSHQGLALAEDFAEHFAKLGFNIVSGLAEGIDGSAHQGALMGMGKTIAVLGNGLDKIYPAKHQTLAQNIVMNGALVSEFPLGTAPIYTNFPRRNRVISGLSLGIIVIEAALKSGSLITAKFALDQGREVFAIPGSIHNPLSKGCHHLIRQGAKLVESVDHVLEELSAWQNLLKDLPKRQKQSKTFRYRQKKVGSKQKQLNESHNSIDLWPHPMDLSEEHQLLFKLIGYDMTPVDTLVAQSQLTVSEVSIMLLDLELQGFIKSTQAGVVRIG